MAVLLGGPLRLVERVEGAGASQCILIRGGPGVGKSIVATYMATEIATALFTNVAYACVELLPLELRAQQEALDATNGWSVLLPEEWSTPGTQHILAAALDLGDRVDEVTTQETFSRELVEVFDRARSSAVVGVGVLVVDSVSEDYGLGGRHVPRHLVDAIAKFAAVNGIVVIVIEETHDLTPSPWSFASDTVLEIDGAPTASGRRRVRVSKNRFGPATSSYGELDIVRRRGPVIYAPASAYARMGVKLLGDGRSGGIRPGAWPSELAPMELPPRDEGTFVFVRGANNSIRTRLVARWVAQGDSDGAIVEFQYGRLLEARPFMGITRSPPIRVEPVGVIGATAELVLDVLRRKLLLAIEDNNIACIHLVTDGARAVDVSEFARTLDVLGELCVALGVPLVCSRVGSGGPEDEIMSLLQQTATGTIEWTSPSQTNAGVRLNCTTPSGTIIKVTPPTSV